MRENRLDVVLVLDVRGKVDGLAIERDGGLVLDFAELFIERRLDLRELAVFKQRLIRGVDDDRAVVAVEQRVVAGLQLLADGLRADDGGDVQRPGENRGVRCLAADVGDEAEDKFFVQLRRHGRAQIVADEDAWLVQMLQVKGVFDLQQVVQHAAGEVAQVGGALAEVFVLDGFQHGDVAVGRGVKGEVGVRLLFADDLDDLLDEHPVFEHQQVRVKNVRLVGAHRLGDAALDLGDLLAGADERLLEALHLGLDVGHFAARDDVARLVQDQHLAPAHARRDGDAAIDFFAFDLP